MTEEQASRELTGDDPARAAQAAAALWDIWCRSGIPEVDRLFRDGVTAMESRDLARAEELFAQIIEIAPDFAEGWNKRATVRYLVEDYAGALVPALREVRRDLDDLGEELLGAREVADLFRRCLEVYPHLTAARQNLAATLGAAVQRNGHQKRPNASASSS
jgi:tetratricopeptide (TPR) repeat protein